MTSSGRAGGAVLGALIFAACGGGDPTTHVSAGTRGGGTETAAEAWSAPRTLLPFADRRAFAVPADDGAAALLVLGGPLARWRAPGAWVAEPAGQVDARRLPVPESRLRFVVPGGFVLLGTAQAASFRSNVDGRPERADLWSAAADAAAVVQVAGRPRLIAAADGVTQAWDVSDLGDVRPVAAGLALPGDVVALRRARSGGRDDHLVTLEDGLVRVWAADASVFRPADAAVVPGRARALREADFDGDGRDELVVATSAGLTLLSLEPDGRIRSLDPVPDTLDAGAPHVAAAAPGAPRTLAWSTPTDVRAVTVGPDLEARAPRSWLRRSGVTSLATGDFDADGDVDLVFTDPLGVHVVEGSR